jgi:hypothetical protein
MKESHTFKVTISLSIKHSENLLQLFFVIKEIVSS